MKAALFKTARLRPDVDLQWTPRGFVPGEIVAVQYWKHEFDRTSGAYRPLFHIAKSADFDKHREAGEVSTVFNSALDSFTL